MPPRLPSHQSPFRPAQYMPLALTKVELTPAQRHLLATSANLSQPAFVCITSTILDLENLPTSDALGYYHLSYTFIDAGPVAVFALRNQGRPQPGPFSTLKAHARGTRPPPARPGLNTYLRTKLQRHPPEPSLISSSRKSVWSNEDTPSWPEPTVGPLITLLFLGCTKCT
ncbi:hypothetical protein PG993_001789 [Apiospora rasikravindrae]|uniref:Velvet domain-containing protein n=1 Tax=Apiospora rasikravindrae TaxID=990691 RepID=A0ABR1UCE2_9PEZI